MSPSTTQQGCVIRHRSSNCSEWDDSDGLFPVFQEDLESATVANLDQLLDSLQKVKQTCLDLDESIVDLKAGKLSKTDYCEVSPFAADETEFSITSQLSSISAKELVRKCRSRATSRGLLVSCTDESTNLNDISGTTIGSSDFSSTQELPERDLPVVSAIVITSNINSLQRNKGQSRGTTETGSASAIDSESDFGISLMSRSLESAKAILESGEYSKGDDSLSDTTLPIIVQKSDDGGENQNLSNQTLQIRIIHGSNAPLDLSSRSCVEEDSGASSNCNPAIPSFRPEVFRRIKEDGSGDCMVKGANRDSAFCEGLDIGFSRLQENIGEKWELIQYSETEWRGHTQRAETIRKGYASIPSTLECFHLRRIRGDNYCAIRAALFQVLLQGLPLLNNFDGCSTVCQKLENWTNSQSPWLRSWSFGSRLPYSRETCIQGFRECVESLDQLSTSSSNATNREEFLVDQFNSDPNLDVRLMEAVKLLMLIVATEMHEMNMMCADIPIFAILLFARETSETPQAFMENHLNFMGDSGGLEQVEMYLLGHTLGVTQRIVRPSKFGCDDYICYYPERDDIRPQVNLIAEDDRHYNIIIK